MDHVEFGEQLIATQDLDPVYTMLHHAQLEPELLHRWLFAYMCFYNAGVASAIAESVDYWQAMEDALPGPRGVERRYFRGPKALWAIHMYSLLGSPVDIMDSIVSSGPTFPAIAKRVKRLPLFGDWIAFKAFDLLSSVLGVEVDVSTCHLHIYKDPLQGAALALKGDWQAPMTAEEVDYTFKMIISQLEHCLAPPAFNRPVNILEAETVACKYKSHYKGRYQVGHDIRDIRGHLSGRAGLAKRLLRYMPDPTGE